MLREATRKCYSEYHPDASLVGDDNHSAGNERRDLEIRERTTRVKTPKSARLERYDCVFFGRRLLKFCEAITSEDNHM